MTPTNTPSREVEKLRAEVARLEKYTADLEAAGLTDLLKKADTPSDIQRAASLEIEAEVVRRENERLRAKLHTIKELNERAIEHAGALVAQRDGLRDAARVRVKKGHSDTCSAELCDGHPCDCGHVALLDALAAAHPNRIKPGEAPPISSPELPLTAADIDLANATIARLKIALQRPCEVNRDGFCVRCGNDWAVGEEPRVCPIRQATLATAIDKLEREIEHLHMGAGSLEAGLRLAITVLQEAS